jgi:hypothetical protein
MIEAIEDCLKNNNKYLKYFRDESNYFPSSYAKLHNPMKKYEILIFKNSILLLRVSPETNNVNCYFVFTLVGIAINRKNTFSSILR